MSSSPPPPSSPPPDDPLPPSPPRSDPTTSIGVTCYSPTLLRRFREDEQCQKWPSFLDEAFKNNRGCWDPDRWHQNRQRGSTPPPGEGDRPQRGEGRPTAGMTPDGKRGAKDRLKAEQQDGLVLSPQRRSFLTGCQVAQDENEGAELSLRPETNADRANSRRIGSGRLMNRADREDYERKYDRREDGRYGFGRGGREEMDPEHGGRRRDRSRDRDRRPQQGDRGDRWNRYDGGGRMDDRDDFGRRGGGNDRRPPPGRNEKHRGGSRFPRRSEGDGEPEWMSAEVEQGELMELRGFDDSPEKDRNAMRTNKKADEEARKKPQTLEAIEKQQHKEQPQPVQNDPQQGFNIDDFLHMDAIDKILNEDGADLAKGGPQNGSRPQESRFSKFFANRQASPPRHGNDPQNILPSLLPPGDEEQRRSSIQDELAASGGNANSILSSLGVDPGEQSIHIPGGNNNEAQNSFYFAPISPAAKTVSPHHPQGNNPLMELLKGNEQGRDFGGHRGGPPALSQLKGKNVKSVEELEADMKQMGVQDNNERVNRQQQQRPAQNEGANEELSAFKKFAAELVNAGSMGPKDNGDQPGHNPFANLTNQPHPQASHGPHGLLRPSPLPANAPTEQEILAQRAAAVAVGGVGNNGPPHFQNRMRLPLHPSQLDLLVLIHSAPIRLDILKRPEAFTLQRALEHGDVTPNLLLTQFAHGNLPPLQREILLQVLKVQQDRGVLPTRLNPHLQALLANPQAAQQQQQQPPQPIPQPQQQQISSRASPSDPNSLALLQQQLQQQGQRISPNFSNNGQNNLSITPTPSGQQRVPSPQELQYHTQQIMQNALIRTKLEQQKENYRRRQEGGGDMPGEKQDSPSQPGGGGLHFTPTVVMKRLAADRRDSDPRPQPIPELRVSQDIGPDGDGVPRQPQQPPQGASNNSRNTSPMAMMPPVPLPPPNPLLMQAGAFPGGIPGLGPQQAGLSRFFSPEVLAQAQSGNAPSMPPLPTQKALTLEEIEHKAAAAAAVRI